MTAEEVLVHTVLTNTTNSVVLTVLIYMFTAAKSWNAVESVLRIAK
jgi:hypothetical protein